MKRLRLLPLLLLLMTGSSMAMAADRLVVCGWDEIYQIDPASETTPPAKLWSWRAKDHPEIPEAIRKTFGTTSDCKPVENGRKLLVVSSGGGCAVLDLPSGKASWWARVTNAHSIEALPGGRLLVASSVGATGNKLVLFDAAVPEKPLGETPLHSAHGIVWDEQRAVVWALDMDELCSYTLGAWDSPAPTLELKSRHALPDDNGHDLRAIPASADLVLSTHQHVWLFDRDKGAFRPHPDLHERPAVKTVEPHPQTGRLVVVQATKPNWWTDTITVLRPAAECCLEGEKIYKVRWMIEPEIEPDVGSDGKG